ncbi:hypothetical protein CAPTEDRAFT_198659 [Capitella teleta]|uniref:SGNH hydrolase-type esterase domain-containing protein n=1 Tax=Capitella teleta TaxID=283909 RepID=R7V1Y9_CAPTE|nr:hypothetical protein CAPTEDRAFT_198659 [Capitella teleta]|eukprot:ELU12863.1 hypothetical protein CAPTEDRAFT_198659 [Capitella teleta]
MNSLLLFAVTYFAVAHGAKRPLSEQYLNTISKLYGLDIRASNSDFLEFALKEQERLLKQKSKRELVVGEPVLDCDTTNPGGEPTTVHDLRPWDIDLVGALGDSITGGERQWEIAVLGGPKGCSIRDKLDEYAANIGGNGSLFGQDRVVSLPNIIRQWNPDVEGFAIGTGGTTNSNSGLNRAVGGATNRYKLTSNACNSTLNIDYKIFQRNMLDQAENLISRIQSDDRYDFDNDWKIITIFVGTNDLCSVCRNSNYDPVAHRDGIEAALDELHANLPRALVQVVGMFDITTLTELSTGELCNMLQSAFCPCAADPETRPEMRPTQLSYVNLLDELISSGKYDTRDDFTVVFQPHMRDIVPPKDENGEYYPDFLSYDCFHPARPAHQMFAMYLWDAMLTPVGEKTYWEEADPNHTVITCPREGAPYIYTNLNSRRMVKSNVDKKTEVNIRQLCNR